MNKIIFFSFTRLLFKKWLFWILYYGGLAGTIVTFKLFKIEIPSWIFVTLAFIGLFWASYKVYEEQLKKIPIPSKKIKEDIKEKPKLSIKLLEGNEYSYKLKKPSGTSKEEDEYIIDDALIILHSRLENIGKIGLDIVTIEVRYNDTGFPWSFLLSFTFKNNKKVNFPKFLDSNEIYICDIQNSMDPKAYRNNAKFAADLSKLDKESCYVDFQITIEAKARDRSKKVFTFTFKDKISLRQLIDLYITKWQDDKQQDLIRLAQIA